MARPFDRWEPRWLLLGAVLPDVVPRLVAAAMDEVPPLQRYGTLEFGVYLGLLHTPFCVAFLVGALAAVARRPGAAAAGLGFGAGLHFVLDVMQHYWGSGTCLWFPFAFQQVTWSVAWYDSPPVYALVGLSAVYMVWSLWRGRMPRDWPFAASGRRAMLLVAGLSVFALTPLVCLERAIAANVGSSRFARHPEDYEGRQIAIAVATVDTASQGLVMIDKADHKFAVDWSGREPVRTGARISVRGLWRDARLWPDGVFIHDYRIKKAASLIGLVMLLCVWWPSLRQVINARGRGVRSRKRLGK